MAERELLPRTAAQEGALSPSDDGFYGLAGQIVRAIEPHTEASSGALLLQLLAGVGYLAGRRAFFPVEGARHYPNLFCVIVGDTAKSRKGTSWNRILSILARIPGWQTDGVVNGLSSGEGLIQHISDATDKRLLVAQTEFASVLKVMSRAGNTLSPALRDSWDGADLHILTRNSACAATGEHVSLIGHITRDELDLQMAKVDMWNGFANRILWCWASRSKLLPHGGSLDDGIIRPLVRELTTVVKWTQRLRDKGITWDATAREEWARGYSLLSRATPGLVGAITSRGEAQVVRLALIYALLDRSPDIRAEHLRAALAVWKFCESSAHTVFASSSGDPAADRIREALKACDGGMTRTQISGLFQGHKSKDDISRALELLRKMEIAECRREAGAGRSSERWFTKEK